MKKMISILVRNRPGVLSHVMGLVTRRGYNVESISAGPTENTDITRMTLVVVGDKKQLEQVTKHIRNLIDVIKVQDLIYSESVTGEVALVTVSIAPDKRNDLMAIANAFSCEIVDLGEKSLTLRVAGSSQKVDMVINSLSQHRVKNMVRTGLVALAKDSLADREGLV